MPGDSGARRHRARGLVALGALVVLFLAACGSRVDASTMARASGLSAGAGGAVTPGDGFGGGEVDLSGGVTDGVDDPGSSDAGTTPGGGADPGSPGSGGGPDADGGPPGSSGGGAEAGSCDGFKNQLGITDDAITVANIADISGPVPGIFEAAQQGTRAYAAYFNSTGTICGRKLEIKPLDSRADAGADQQQTTRACDETFAAVGSMSAFDSGGAATAEECGMPDMRALSVTPERLHCTTCFSAYALSPNLVPDVMPRFFLEKFPEATQHVAVLFVNIGAAAVNAESFRSGWASNGWTIDYFEGIDTAEFNYAPYVQQMRDKGIRFVVYLGPYQFTVRLQQAMSQQNFEPDVFLQDPTIYDQRYVDEAGADGDGSYVYATHDLFDAKTPEMTLYRSWLQQIKPGAIPNYYGMYAWSATKLFVEQALALGGELDRPSMIEALRGVKGWTGNGLHTGQPVGSKATGPCIKIIRLDQGRWSQVSPGNYICGGMTNTGIGG